MKLTKRQTFFSILAAGVVVCLLYQSIWIFSRTTNAEIYAVTANANKESRITWMRASYKVGYDAYYGSYLKNDYDISHRFFKIRYLVFDPEISRSDTFASNWGPLIMFFIVLSVITSIVFIRKDIVADGAVFIFQPSRPFVAIKNNRIEDYDEHDMEKANPGEAEKGLKTSLQSKESMVQNGEVRASVYKYNPNAIVIIVIYVFFFFWFFYSLLTMSMGYPEIFSFGALLIFVPLFVQNTNNPIFKMKIPDEGSLVFSAGGMQFKEDFYSVDHIESAVVYLESFKGFEYRDHVTIGTIRTKSSGDNNKISCRVKEDVIDFTFILDDAADYWLFKTLMSNWSAKGINVILQKVFEDDFIIQEMAHFHTSIE